MIIKTHEGLRTWIEEGFNQANPEWGWADARVPADAAIERW